MSDFLARFLIRILARFLTRVFAPKVRFCRFYGDEA